MYSNKLLVSGLFLISWLVAPHFRHLASTSLPCSRQFKSTFLITYEMMQTSILHIFIALVYYFPNVQNKVWAIRWSKSSPIILYILFWSLMLSQSTLNVLIKEKEKKIKNVYFYLIWKCKYMLKMWVMNKIKIKVKFIKHTEN